ncbi:MAG: ferritin-like domain-containing protein [Actinomycetota bacterium]|nr:ferritin-like domain-containing protein [Actinomycetota bacterium]
MSIDQRRLVDLTDEVDQQHHESMRTFREDAEEIHFGEPAQRRRASRRSLLAKAGAGGALLTLGAMTGPVSRFLPAAAAATDPESALVMFAASMEFAVVAAYQSMLDSSKLSGGAAKTARTFQGHHRDHGRAFNAITLVTTEKPNAKIVAAFKPKLKAASNEKGLLEVAYTIEEDLAATYLSTLGILADKSNAGVVASILPVESQHAVVLAQVVKKKIGEYMPPFQNDKLALDPSAYPV